MIGLPPVEEGACQVIVTLPIPGVDVTPVGAPGAVAGVMAIALLRVPLPASLCAATENE